MNVLSLCDGMSCIQIALKELDIKVDNYYSSEIDKNAIKVTQDNFPNTIQLGDAISLSENKNLLSSLPKIDLVAFGFTCRSMSKANAGKDGYNQGLRGVSKIFFNCLDVLNYIKKYNNVNVKFLVENVMSYNTEDLNIISKLLGCEYHRINSNLFSAQDRDRLYWTNIPINSKVEAMPIVIKDILDSSVDEKYYYKQTFDYLGYKKICANLHINGHDIIKRVNHIDFKSPTLTSCRGGNTQKKILDGYRVRKLTPNEYRKLQTIPDWYIMDVADSHIYNMCGDGMTIEVVKFILKGLKL